MDYLARLATVVPIALIVALLCATLICLVAICHAHRGDVVAVLRALPAISFACPYTIGTESTSFAQSAVHDVGGAAGAAVTGKGCAEADPESH
ncbi:hypothetical protein ACWEF9_23570 [Streptomyces sp. NPDC004980]